MTPLQEIERDLDWREAELGILKILLANESIGEREKLVLYRAAWALLYAHYEGFCKFALTVYYDTIQKSGKCHEELPKSIQALALDREVNVLRNLPTVDFLSRIMSFDTEIMKKTAKFPDVDTESNLWPKTLLSLLDHAEIDLPTLNSSNRSLATLVSRRNKIAHGERDIIPEYGYYAQYDEVVRNVMYDLAITIDDKLKSI